MSAIQEPTIIIIIIMLLLREVHPEINLIEEEIITNTGQSMFE